MPLWLKRFRWKTFSNNTIILDGLTIRRSIIKGEKMYVLTDDSKLFIVKPLPRFYCRMNTANVTGGDRALVTLRLL